MNWQNYQYVTIRTVLPKAFVKVSLKTGCERWFNHGLPKDVIENRLLATIHTEFGNRFPGLELDLDVCAIDKGQAYAMDFKCQNPRAGEIAAFLGQAVQKAYAQAGTPIKHFGDA